MKHFSIKTRLVLLVGTLLALLVAASAAGVLRLQASNASLQTIYEDRVVPLKQLKTVADGFAVSVVDTAHKTRDGALTPQAGLAAAVEARQRIAEQWRAYTATYLVPREKELVAKAEPLLAGANQATQRLEALLRAGDIDGLRTFAAKDMYPAIDPISAVIDELVAVQLQVAEQEYRQSQLAYERMLQISTALTLLAVAGASFMAWRIVRAIVRGIAQAVKVAETVAAGDLGSRIEVHGRDEIAQLLGALKCMNDNLAGIVGQVRSASDAIACGSTQIAAGSLSLSQRTEEQAASLEQTAASMEQLTATVKNNADAARQADALAGGASAVAAQGGTVVGQVVSTMDDISASSRRIADIVGVIDGIAFQTNILALNASVESARAGEQGRGFAVVAGEVRTLAQRAAQSAKEIKGLVGASVSQVDDGGRHVANAGRTMQDIVAQVKRVTELISGISHSSGEQSTGLRQIADAMAQLDNVTQQNAALVEQSAAAAENLQQQAARLTRLVSTFRLNATVAMA